MRSVARAIVGAVLVASVASAQADSSRGKAPAPAPACRPARELEAAKAALARGDKQAALDRLRRADAALAACERDRATPIPELESTDHALAHVAGTVHQTS